ncbi:unnamed protein product [Caenorhabditis bovis]|uniref:Uncharacterized protein n=1 Tax=Caenorhabditis bovis TaxID=2654633 RepID=A0A8S1EWX8_9PELO|nr:unnamed protein product [Caenorhabditis bovis]
MNIVRISQVTSIEAGVRIYQNKKNNEQPAIPWRKFDERLEEIVKIFGGIDHLRMLLDAFQTMPFTSECLTHAFHVFYKAIDIVKEEFDFELECSDDLEEEVSVLCLLNQKNSRLIETIEKANEIIKMVHRVNEILDLYERIVDTVTCPPIQPNSNAFHPIFVNLYFLHNSIVGGV